MLTQLIRNTRTAYQKLLTHWLSALSPRWSTDRGGRCLPAELLAGGAASKHQDAPTSPATAAPDQVPRRGPGAALDAHPAREGRRRHLPNLQTLLSPSCGQGTHPLPKQDDPRQGRRPSGSHPSVSGGGRTAAEQSRGREGRLKKTAETGESGRSTGGWTTLWEEEIRPRAPGASRLALRCGEASFLQAPGLDLGCR